VSDETYMRLAAAAERATAGGSPADTFKAYRLDPEQVAEYAYAAVPSFRSKQPIEKAIWSAFQTGIAVGMELARTEPEEER
jgi:hypothetical protein